MSFLGRLGYYLLGFSAGLIILTFVLNEKKTSCDYGPGARVKKNIRTKKLIYADEIELKMKANAIDSTDISTVIKIGTVDFSESEPRRKPCQIYAIDGKIKLNQVSLIVENCDTIAKLVDLRIKSID